MSSSDERCISVGVVRVMPHTCGFRGCNTDPDKKPFLAQLKAKSQERKRELQHSAKVANCHGLDEESEGNMSN